MTHPREAEAGAHVVRLVDAEVGGERRLLPGQRRPGRQAVDDVRRPAARGREDDDVVAAAPIRDARDLLRRGVVVWRLQGVEGEPGPALHPGVEPGTGHGDPRQREGTWA